MSSSSACSQYTVVSGTSTNRTVLYPLALVYQSVGVLFETEIQKAQGRRFFGILPALGDMEYDPGISKKAEKPVLDPLTNYRITDPDIFCWDAWRLEHGALTKVRIVDSIGNVNRMAGSAER